MNTEIIARFLTPDGKVKTYPTKFNKQMEILSYIATKFANGAMYDEIDVNEIIASWITFEDYVVIRRDLVENKLLLRTKDGKQYWKNDIIKF